MLNEKSLPAHLLVFQKNEITEYHIYKRLADGLKNKKNAEILRSIAEDERRHCDFWRKYTKIEVKPDQWKVFWYYWISRIFGITFGIKLMEAGEARTQSNYAEVAKKIPEACQIISDEDMHEKKLIGLIEEERLNYIGSMVLGLNDALVELTGALAGFTFALQNTKLIALTGLITGIAASFSMASSEYLAKKSAGEEKTAVKSSIYTGFAYIITVFLLILPYLFISNYLVCLGLTMFIAIMIIFFFNFYISVAKNYSFKQRFFEMAALSLGVSLFSFLIGYILRTAFGVEI